jgi:Flagellar assembly protein T, C-terminal domain
VSISRPSSSKVFTAARLVASALAVAMLGSPSAVSAGAADQVGATFGLMIQDVVAAFPAVEGMVVAVEGDRIYLDLTEKDGVRPGQEFTIFRKGEVFRHPLNGRPLGRYEQVLGHAQVQRVLPQFSEAVYVAADGQSKARAEDGVRITKGRIRVAVAPTTDLTSANADLRRVPFMLAHALSETKRFQSADPSAVQELLLTQKTRSEELLVRPDKAVAVAKPLEVTGWLVPVLIERRGVTYLDVTWVSAVTGAALFSRRLALTRAETAAEQRFPWEPVPQD